MMTHPRIPGSLDPSKVLWPTIAASTLLGVAASVLFLIGAVS